MFSKYGRNLNIKFLKSTISFASIRQSIVSNQDSINIKPKKKKRKKFLQVKTKTDLPCVGHYKIKYASIDPHISIIKFKRPKNKRRK